MAKSPITFSKKITVQVPPEQLWSFLADTDRLDRAVGIPPISFTPDPNKKGYNLATTTFKGIRLEYEEFPYEWVEPQYYKILRRFTKGPVEEILTGIKLVPKNGGTEFETFTEIIPRTAFGSFLANTAIKPMATRHLVSLVKKFEEYSKDSVDSTPPILPKKETINGIQLEARLEKLKNSSATSQLIDKLKKHLLQSSDLDVVSMRPFEIADRWGEERMDVLFFFLLATKAGVLNLHWTVLCPNCRGTTEEPTSLSKLKAQAHCPTCEITYGTDLAASVEARFSVNPAVRRARHETYCIAGPANLPQIIAQLRVESGQSRKEILNLKPGIIRVRSFQTDGFHQIQVQPTSTISNLEVEFENNHFHLNTNALQAGTVEVSIKNQSDKEILAIIERETWRENSATAVLVTSLQHFKDLFPEEAVAPGKEIGIGSLTIMFTDLRSSTPLYTKIGDTKAFSFVQNHFRFLTESVSKHRGGILKTMGDAIMAQFATSLDALKASIEIQQQWETFSKAFEISSDVNIKIGIHQGHAIAINNRGTFDCFGATINLAARLQKFSDGGDVILSDAAFNDPDVGKFLAESKKLQTTSFKAQLKGFDKEQFKLWRIQVNSTME